MKGVALALVCVMTMVFADETQPTAAAWVDSEWVSGPVGAVDCEAAQGAFATRGAGKLLGGSLGSLDLDEIAELSGIEVTNDGTRALATPDSGSPVGADDFANPLNAGVLDSIAVDLGNVLQLPLDNDTGVLGQYGQAESTGRSAGAAGYITSTGGIATTTDDGYPDLATLSLSKLVASISPETSALLAAATDISLEVGAVASRADLDGCSARWDGISERADGNLSRDYLLSHLATMIDSPVVGQLGTSVDSALSTLTGAANGIAGNTGLLSSVAGSVAGGVTNLLSTVIGLVGLRVKPGGQPATAAVTLDLSPVQALLNQPIGDDVVSISLTDGTVQIDTASLLAAAYPGEYSTGLNGLPPNSQPIQDSQVLGTLTASIGDLLADFIDRIQSALTAAVDSANITATIAIPLEQCNGIPAVLACVGTWKDAGAIGVTVNGSLASLLQNAGTIAVDTSALGLLGDLLSSLVNAIVPELTATVGNVVGTAVDGLLRPRSSLPSDILTTAGQPITDLVGTVFSTLYVTGLVSVTVNAQNDPADGGDEPADWADLPDSQFDVAALRIRLLGSTLGARLYFARSSVGVACSLADPRCADY